MNHSIFKFFLKICFVHSMHSFASHHNSNCYRIKTTLQQSASIYCFLLSKALDY